MEKEQEFISKFNSLDSAKYDFFDEFLQRLNLVSTIFYPTRTKAILEHTTAETSNNPEFIAVREVYLFSGEPYVRFSVINKRTEVTDKEFEKKVFGSNPADAWFFYSKSDELANRHKEYITQSINKKKKDHFLDELVSQFEEFV